LAATLGRPGKIPSSKHLDFFRFLATRERALTGAVGASDYFFITAFVSVLAPKRAVEIGTLTGFSAAVLAAAIICERGDPGRAVVDTIDRASECAVAPKPIGFEIPEIIPEFPGAVRIHSGRDSGFVQEIAAPNELGLVLIDASHKHPWPLLDLLRLAPFVRGGGWVLLHDIKLGTLRTEMALRGECLPFGGAYGAEWLFDAWPFRKVSGGNIGAVQVPHARSTLLPFSVQMMRTPFETQPTKKRELQVSLYRALTTLSRRPRSSLSYRGSATKV